MNRESIEKEVEKIVFNALDFLINNMPEDHVGRSGAFHGTSLRIRREITDYILERERGIRSLLIEADSDLSYLIHRGGIKWENFDDENLKESLLKTVGKLRKKHESLTQQEPK